jgi:hypothetical protein
MTLNHQDGLAARVSLATPVRTIAGPFLPMHGSEPRTVSLDGLLSRPVEGGGAAGYLLTWTAALAFCSSLIGLAALPRFGVAVPRWLIFADGVVCTLLPLLAMLLSRPWRQLQPSAHQQHLPLKGVDADGGWAATWNGPLPRCPHGDFLPGSDP